MRRAFAGILALWFTVLTVEPARLHACPMHDGLAMGAMQMEHAGHAGHAHHAPADQDSSKHACSCLGSCGTSAHAALPSAPVSIDLTPIAARVSTPVLASAPVSRRPHELPFANGPPARI